jgi:hypothetical protein
MTLPPFPLFTPWELSHNPPYFLIPNTYLGLLLLFFLTDHMKSCNYSIGVVIKPYGISSRKKKKEVSVLNEGNIKM